MTVTWSKEKSICEEYGCGGTLGRGHRHHCRNCGKSICDDCSVIASSPRFQNKFTNKKTSKINNFFYGAKVKPSLRNKRVCLTCAIQKNLSTRPLQKRFASSTSASSWIETTFPATVATEEDIRTRKHQIDNVILYKGFVYRGDDYRTWQHIFKEGFVQRSNEEEILQGLKKFSNFVGKKLGGHTAAYGISTTRKFSYAYQWLPRVYVIDLHFHPFAVDIVRSVNETLSWNKSRKPTYEEFGFQAEVNVANSISKHQIAGAYMGNDNMFIHNPNYDPDYGNY